VALAQATSSSQRQIARSWFKTAVDKQQRPALLMPPVALSPMELRLAQYYLAAEDSAKAVESYQSAIRRRPNDLQALMGYRDSLKTSGREKEAAQVDAVISAVKE
jgi:tetratricopeptide (TPR) repeat protein